jgi:hypothetical protein
MLPIYPSTYYSLIWTSGPWVCSTLCTQTLYVSLHTALCLTQTQCMSTRSGWVPECTWAPADQEHEISVACLMMYMYVTFPCVNVWMCVLIISVADWMSYWYVVYFLWCIGMAPSLPITKSWCVGMAFGCLHALEYCTCMSSTELQNNVLTWMAAGQTI